MNDDAKPYRVPKEIKPADKGPSRSAITWICFASLMTFGILSAFSFSRSKTLAIPFKLIDTPGAIHLETAPMPPSLHLGDFVQQYTYTRGGPHVLLGDEVVWITEPKWGTDDTQLWEPLGARSHSKGDTSPVDSKLRDR